jgi:hypothetical protein
MLVIIEELLRTAIAFFHMLFTGGLPRYFYGWCIGFTVFSLLYAYWDGRRGNPGPRAYVKSFLQETAGHALLWIVAILIAQFFAGIIDQGITPADSLAYYSIGLIIVVIYDLSVVFSIGIRPFGFCKETAETGAFLFGLLAAYLILPLAGTYILPAFTVAAPYRITLSIVCGVLALLYPLSQRAEYGGH